MYQLIYTSAPRLLEAGKTGFGTLARSKEMPQPLVSYIERLSTFDRAAGINSLCFYSLFRQGALRYHVFSHVAEAGADYTGRTNHLAEHFAVEVGSSEDRELMDSTPAGVLMTLASRWHETYKENPSYLGEGALPPGTPRSAFGAWEGRSGNDDCARWLAQPNYKSGACLRFNEVMEEKQALPLIHDAFLHLHNHGWGVGFSTATVSNLSAKVVPFTVLDARQAAAGVTCPRGCPELKITQGMQAPPKDAPAPAAADSASAPQPLQCGDGAKVYRGAVPSLPTAPPPGDTPPPPSAPPAPPVDSVPPALGNDEAELTYFGGGARPPKPQQSCREQEGKSIPMPVVVGGSILIGALLAFALLKNDSPEASSPPKPAPKQKPAPGQKPAPEPKEGKVAKPAGQIPAPNSKEPEKEEPHHATPRADISAQRNKVADAARQVEQEQKELDKLGNELPPACREIMEAAHAKIDEARKTIDAAQNAADADKAVNHANSGVSKAKDALSRAREYKPKTPTPSTSDTPKPDAGKDASMPHGGESAPPPAKPKRVDPFQRGASTTGSLSSGSFMQEHSGVAISAGSSAQVPIAKKCVKVLNHKPAGQDGKMELDIEANFQWEELPEKWREQFSDKEGSLIQIYRDNGELVEIRPGDSCSHKAHIEYTDKMLKDLFDNRQRLEKNIPDAIGTCCDNENIWKPGKKTPKAKENIDRTVERIDELLGTLEKSPYKTCPELKTGLDSLKAKLQDFAKKPNDSWQNTLDNVNNNLLNKLEECLQKPTTEQRITEIVEQKLFLGDFSVTLTVESVEGDGCYLNLKKQHTYKQP